MAQRTAFDPERTLQDRLVQAQGFPHTMQLRERVFVLGCGQGRGAAPREPSCAGGAVWAEANMARILLADDDAATRDLVQRALGLDGHDVAATQDGAEALEKLQAVGVRFDVLITDVQMPGLDGVALIERSLALHPRLRVVLMSGFADEIGRAAHLKPRIARIISKPFTLEQIRSAVKAALG
jgi:two-component system, cell cycle response regulator CpdR